MLNPPEVKVAPRVPASELVTIGLKPCVPRAGSSEPATPLPIEPESPVNVAATLTPSCLAMLRCTSAMVTFSATCSSPEIVRRLMTPGPLLAPSVLASALPAFGAAAVSPPAWLGVAVTLVGDWAIMARVSSAARDESEAERTWPRNTMLPFSEAARA